MRILSPYILFGRGQKRSHLSSDWFFFLVSDCPNQDVLQTVSTTARYDPCRLQGCDVGWFGRIGAGVQDERVCLRLTKTKAGDITTRLVRRSPYSFEDTMNLNLYEADHFSYVSNMEKYSYSYSCLKCDRLWKHVGTLHRHERICTGSATSFIMCRT